MEFTRNPTRGLGPFTSVLILLLATPLAAQQEDQEGVRDRERMQQRMQQMMNRPEPGALKVGEQAPRFVLKSLDGESETDLDQLIGDKPIVLLFGSYT